MKSVGAQNLQIATGRNLAVRCLTGADTAPSLEFMDVRLSPDQEAFVRQAIEAGRLRNAEDAVRQACRFGKSGSEDGWRLWPRLKKRKRQLREAKD